MVVVPFVREEDAREKAGRRADGCVNPLAATRLEYGLSLTQAALALDVTATQLERDELRDQPSYDPRRARQRYEVFCARNPVTAGKNLLLDSVPVRVVRDITGQSVEMMAKRFGVSVSQWRKMECHARPMPAKVRAELELDLVEHFSTICARAKINLSG